LCAPAAHQLHAPRRRARLLQELIVRAWGRFTNVDLAGFKQLGRFSSAQEAAHFANLYEVRNIKPR
jgi:hypothetical protein